MTNALRLGLLVTTLGLSMITAGCGEEDASQPPAGAKKAGDKKAGGTAVGASGTESNLGLRFLPEKSFSGFDGVHTFKAPVAVYDSADDLVVAPVDPAAVDVVPASLKEGAEDDGKYFMVTVKKAGVHTITATSKGKKIEIALTATQYQPTQWTAGEARYQAAGSTGDPPCVQCHRGGEAIDHSPAALSTATDKTVGTVITSGRSTFGFPIEINGQPGHKWTVSEEERQSLVVYLRGLPPVGFQ